jgi:pyruvate/2-oxoglutarate dehydrogenase complex dihydrolipoamide acyltransferase (E2) component
MARADLSAMLGRLEDEPAPAASAPKKSATTTKTAPTATKPPATRTPRSAAAPKPESSEPGEGAGPLYLRLDRKETRLRSDQYERLTEHSRRLNRAKGSGGERITENTLIRIAIDLLLERADDLAGTNEIELKNSVTL